MAILPSAIAYRVTRHAATALGLQNDIGTLEVGKRANVALWDTDDPADLSYSIGGNLCAATYHNGRARK